MKKKTKSDGQLGRAARVWQELLTVCLGIIWSTHWVPQFLRRNFLNKTELIVKRAKEFSRGFTT